MGGEIFSITILISALILIGLSVGFLMIRIQGGEE
jgi:cytochrome b6-f complex subunit 7